LLRLQVANWIEIFYNRVAKSCCNNFYKKMRKNRDFVFEKWKNKSPPVFICRYYFLDCEKRRKAFLMYFIQGLYFAVRIRKMLNSKHLGCKFDVRRKSFIRPLRVPNLWAACDMQEGQMRPANIRKNLRFPK